MESRLSKIEREKGIKIENNDAIFDDAHEIWALAQSVPGDGGFISDAAFRIYEKLMELCLDENSSISKMVLMNKVGEE